MFLIRIDDYPTGVRPILPDHIQRLGTVLDFFESRKIPYLLGVVPNLLTPADYTYLKNLRYAEFAMHGCDHLYGHWKDGDIDNEFFGLSYYEVKCKVSESLVKISELAPSIFIPPFNTVTNELLDVLHEKGFITICTSEHTHLETYISCMKLHEIKTPDILYGRASALVQTIKSNMDILRTADFSIGLHITWEDDDLVAQISGLDKLLDLIYPYVKSWGEHSAQSTTDSGPGGTFLVHSMAQNPSISNNISVNSSDCPVRILHITEQLSKGGAGRALIANAKYSCRMGHFQHKVISIAPVIDGVGFEGLNVMQAPSLDIICKEIEQADIVQWHWWQPIALMRQKLPKHFALIICHTSGNRSPHQLTQFELDFADHVVAVCKYSLEMPVFRDIPQEKLSMIIAGADFERVLPVTRIHHDGFNTGWIGTIDDNRYPSDFLAVHAGINIPNFKVLMVGMGPMWYLVREQVRRLNMADRFKLLGYRENMRLIYGRLDVYGFYLNEQTTAAAELNLQESMVSGLPIVMLPHGGPKYMIENGKSGIIASTTREYQQAIEYLYVHPEERRRIGENAQRTALEHFGAENTARQMNTLYLQIVHRIQ